MCLKLLVALGWFPFDVSKNKTIKLNRFYIKFENPFIPNQGKRKMSSGSEYLTNDKTFLILINEMLNWNK